ncbi:hypothetical protein BFV94_3537 [Alteromonas macleodii]|nr:hypothetical protein BFV94_3537 [Alteromonas macleodii]
MFVIDYHYYLSQMKGEINIKRTFLRNSIKIKWYEGHWL